MAITLASNFDETAAVPLDSRYTRADTTARDAIVSGVRFQGLQVFTLADQKLWVLKTGLTNSDWVEAGGGGGSGAWGGITGTLTDQTDLTSELALKAPLASPALTGTPTAPTAAIGTNTTQLATTAFVIANAPAGGINWVTPSDGISATGYNVYADAAGVVPVDGTGGSPTVTIAVSAVTPLRGTSSYLFTKPASNVQGQGWSKDFTIDSGFIDNPVAHTISMLARVASGTYADGDVTFWIVDTTSGQVIQPSAFRLLNAVGAQILRMEFQPNFNSANYRLVSHVTSVSAVAYSLRFDDVSVSPNTAAASGSGSVVSFSGTQATQALTIDVTNMAFTTTKDSSAAWNGTQYVVPVSGDYSIAGSFSSSANTSSSVFLDGTRVFYGSTVVAGGVTAWSGTLTNLRAGQLISVRAASTTTASVGYCSIFRLSGGAASGDSSGVTVARANSTTTAMSASQGALFTVIDFDTNGGFSTVSSATRYTVREAGYFTFSGGFYAAAGGWNVVLYRNGALYEFGTPGSAATGATKIASTPIRCIVGDFFELRANTAVTGTGVASEGYFGVQRISGPTQVSASEKISASYFRSATASVTANTQTNFDTKVYDSHGAVTVGASWKFTAPDARIYTVKAYYDCVPASAVFVFKNGVAHKRMFYTAGAGAPVTASLDIQLNAGDTLDLRPNATGNVAGGTLSSNASWIDITSQG